MLSKWLPRENAITIIFKAPALAEKMVDKLECVSTSIQLNWNVKSPKEALLGFQKASTRVHTQLQWHSAVLSITSASFNAIAQKGYSISLTSFGLQNEPLTQMNMSSLLVLKTVQWEHLLIHCPSVVFNYHFHPFFLLYLTLFLFPLHFIPET